MRSTGALYEERGGVRTAPGRVFAPDLDSITAAFLREIQRLVGAEQDLVAAGRRRRGLSDAGGNGDAKGRAVELEALGRETETHALGEQGRARARALTWDRAIGALMSAAGIALP